MVEFWNFFSTALSYFAVSQLTPHNNDNPQQPRRCFTVIVEGNVGAGKSTLLEHLASREGVTSFPESVSSWTNISGVDLLDRAIHQGDRWAGTFQLYSSLTRFKAFHEAKTSQSDVCLLERSLYSERYVFVESMTDAGILTPGETALLDRWFNFVTKKPEVDNKVDLIVYIRSDPSFLMERVQGRGRSEEKDMDQKNLDTVHRYYEQWLMERKFPVPAPVLVIESGKQSKQDFLDLIDRSANQILGKA